ncbi:MAG: hypothetical protein K2O88_05825 [Paramuribaculum sp.]|nr:hypothetical protein [Paramuribaculum sp.]
MTPQQLLRISSGQPLIVVIADGMHEPGLDVLGGLTPWQKAECERMRMMTEDEICLVPEGLEASTDVAMLTLLGYDARKYIQCRAPFEALGVGLDVADNEIVVRCNLVKIMGDSIVSHCGDGVTNMEARDIVSLLNDNFATENMSFHAIEGFRCLLKVRGDGAVSQSTPPHDILQKPFPQYLIADECLLDLNVRANKLLASRSFNANGIWLWGAGRLCDLPHFGLCAASISGTPLVRGISRAAGIEVVDVAGADGTLNTNLFGKADAAIRAARNHDIILVHVEACDEVSHQRDTFAKIRMIKRIDDELVKPLQDYVLQNNAALVVLSDHATSSVTGRHLSIPVSCYSYNLK